MGRITANSQNDKTKNNEFRTIADIFLCQDKFMRHLYGIPNCSTVKKARAWLEARQIGYVFHDFKKEAPTAEWLAGCLQHVPLEILLNKRGTTWRKLTPEEQAQAADESGAIALMCAYPSLIKRPVLTGGNGVLAGFDEAQYAQYMQAAG